MEISVKINNLMTNRTNGFPRENKVNRQKLGTVTSFKYPGALVREGGFKEEVLSRIEQGTADLTKLKLFWRDTNKSLGSKVELVHSCFFIFIFLYACES